MVGGPHIPTQDMLATVGDLLALRLWQASSDPKSPKPKPRPLPRIGDEHRKAKADERMGARARAYRARLQQGG